MRQITLRLLYAFAVIAAVTGSHGVAYAQCTVPPGNAGEQFYNTTHSVMQYCNGSDWVNMGAIGGGGGGSGAGAPMIDQFAAAGAVITPVTIAATGNKWPDYLVCVNTAAEPIMIHLQNYSATVRYRDGASSFIYSFNPDGTFNNRDHVAANCGAAAGDINSICNDNRCGFFGGGGGGGAGLPGGCTNDQVAKWNGAAWVCAADDAGGRGGSDTLAGLSCSTNQIAKWNGPAWVCAADETGGGGAGCAGGWAHMQIWRTGNWPIVSCGVDGHLRQCQNGLVVTLATAPQDCGGG